MSRRTRSGSISGQFAPRLIEMLESPAHRVLSKSATRVIERIEIELAHHGGKDNGRLAVTLADFERFGIDRQGISPAIREAVALGFVEVTERGRAGNAEFRRPNLYRLTFRPSKGQSGDGTHEWRKTANHPGATDAENLAAAAAIAKAARMNKDHVAVARAVRVREKQFLGVEKHQISGWKNPPESDQFIGGKNHPAAIGGKTHPTFDTPGRDASSPPQRSGDREAQDRRKGASR
jgi:hypothetical protein